MLSGDSFARSGHALEWHVVLCKSIEDIAFHLMPGFHHSIIFLLPAFSLARFKAIGSVGDAMGCDGVEQLLVESPAECRVTITLERNQWLERFECLDRALEADRPWFDTVFAGRLGKDGANEIVSKDVRPNLLPHQLRCLTS